MGGLRGMKPSDSGWCMESRLNPVAGLLIGYFVGRWRGVWVVSVFCLSVLPPKPANVYTLLCTCLFMYYHTRAGGGIQIGFTRNGIGQYGYWFCTNNFLGEWQCVFFRLGYSRVFGMPPYLCACACRPSISPRVPLVLGQHSPSSQGMGGGRAGRAWYTRLTRVESQPGERLSRVSGGPQYRGTQAAILLQLARHKYITAYETTNTIKWSSRSQ